MNALPFFPKKQWPAEKAGRPDPEIVPPEIVEGSLVDVLYPNGKVARRMLAVSAVDPVNNEVQVDARDEGKNWVPRKFVRQAIVEL